MAPPGMRQVPQRRVLVKDLAILKFRSVARCLRQGVGRQDTLVHAAFLLGHGKESFHHVATVATRRHVLGHGLEHVAKGGGIAEARFGLYQGVVGLHGQQQALVAGRDIVFDIG